MESPCEVGGGDCNYEEDCAGDLVCGKFNCQDFHPLAESYVSCCVEPVGELVLKRKSIVIVEVEEKVDLILS